MGGPMNANKGDLDEEDCIFLDIKTTCEGRDPRVTMSISIRNGNIHFLE